MLGGVARTATLRAHGISKRELSAAVAAGVLVRARIGLYVTAPQAPQVIEALGHRGVVACVTAARRYGLWTLDDGDAEPLHTWVDPERHPARLPSAPCCVMHRDHAVGVPSLWIVGIAHCLVQLAWCKGEESFFAALESALRLGVIRRGDLTRLRRLVPVGMTWLVDFARSDADSGLESLLRLRLHRVGVTLRSQVAIPGVGVADFVLGDCLILEADGATHGGDNRHRDLVRDAVALRLGFVTLRFDSAMILHEWELVEATILAALHRRLHVGVRM